MIPKPIVLFGARSLTALPSMSSHAQRSNGVTYSSITLMIGFSPATPPSAVPIRGQDRPGELSRPGSGERFIQNRPFRGAGDGEIFLASVPNFRGLFHRDNVVTTRTAAVISVDHQNNTVVVVVNKNGSSVEFVGELGLG